MDIDEKAPGNISQQGVGGTTDNESSRDPEPDNAKLPLPDDENSLLDEEMVDVDANNSVSGEHPHP